LLAQAEIEASKLNTPNTEKIDKLFENTLGIRNVSKSWIWPSTTRGTVIRRLHKLIEVRGEIAHRGEASDSVTKYYIERSTGLVSRLAAITSNRIRSHIYALIKKYPWQKYNFSLK